MESSTAAIWNVANLLLHCTRSLSWSCSAYNIWEETPRNATINIVNRPRCLEHVTCVTAVVVHAELKREDIEYETARKLIFVFLRNS